MCPKLLLIPILLNRAWQMMLYLYTSEAQQRHGNAVFVLKTRIGPSMQYIKQQQEPLRTNRGTFAGQPLSILGATGPFLAYTLVPRAAHSSLRKLGVQQRLLMVHSHYLGYLSCVFCP